MPNSHCLPFCPEGQVLQQHWVSVEEDIPLSWMCPTLIFTLSCLQNLGFIPASLTPFSKELVNYDGNIYFIA